MVLTEAHAILEQGQQGKIVLQGLGEAHRHARLARVAVGVAQVEVLSKALDEVVLGQPDPLVGPHAVVAQILLAVEAVGRGRVLLVAGAALGLAQEMWLQQAPVGVMEARRAPDQSAPVVVVVAVLVVDLLLGAHHHVQQVVEQEVGGRQGVHPGLGDGHLLVASGAPQLQRVPGTTLALQAVSAEGVQAGQDVEPPGSLARGGRGVRGRRGRGRAGGDGSRGAAELLAERARLQVRVGKRSHLQPLPKHGISLERAQRRG